MPWQSMTATGRPWNACCPSRKDPTGPGRDAGAGRLLIRIRRGGAILARVCQ